VVTIPTTYFNIKTLHFAYTIHVTSSKTSLAHPFSFSKHTGVLSRG